ncbi:MAG: hypothetical protein WCB26_13325, partial [Pseudolabrys sp.]
DGLVQAAARIADTVGNRHISATTWDVPSFRAGLCSLSAGILSPHGRAAPPRRRPLQPTPL